MPDNTDTTNTNADVNTTGDIPVPTDPPRLVDSFMIISLGVGLLLIGISQFVPQLGPSESRLVLVMGLGLILGALGSAAVVKYKTFVITGAAAIGLILGWFLTGQVSQSLGKIDLYDLPPIASVEMQSNSNFYGARSEPVHKFLVTPAQVQGKKWFKSTIVDEGTGKEYFFKCMDISRIELGGENALNLYFELKIERDEQGNPVSDADGNSVTKGAILKIEGEDGQIFGESGKCIGQISGNPRSAHSQDLDLPNSITTHAKQLIPSFISDAFASDLSNPGQLIKSLESNSSAVRRSARKTLAKAGDQAIAPMLEEFAKPDASYRTQLGVLVALTSILEADPASASGIRNQISNQQLATMARLAGHKDETIANFAADVLGALQDPRAAEAINQTLDNVDASRANDVLLLLKETLAYASQDGKTAAGSANIKDSFSQNSSATTQALVEQIQKTADSDAPVEQNYYVVAGAYSSQANAQKASKKFADSGFTVRIAKPTSTTDYYRIILGDYSDLKTAKALGASIAEQNIKSPFFISPVPYQF